MKPLNWSLFEPHIQHLLHMSSSTRQAQTAMDQLISAAQRTCQSMTGYLDNMRKILTEGQGARLESVGLAAAIKAIGDMEAASRSLAAACNTAERTSDTNAPIRDAV